MSFYQLYPKKKLTGSLKEMLGGHRAVLGFIFFAICFTGSFAQPFGTGNSHSFAVCSNKTAMSWGLNSSGQLGNGTTVNDSVPKPVSVLTNINKVEAGSRHSLFLKDDSTVWGVGQNIYGQLGDSSQINRTSAVQVKGMTGIIQIAAMGATSHFLRKDSTVWACGYNGYGECGNGTNEYDSVPRQASITGVVAVASGYYHTVYLKSNGTAWSCGRNAYGELGIGSCCGSRSTPVQVAGLTGIKKVKAGGRFLLFLLNDSTVWGCGLNTEGQLGNGTTTSTGAGPAVQVSGLTGVIDIEAGYYHSVFLKKDSTVWACGRNTQGQLGDGSFTQRTTPVQVSGLTGVRTISAGYYQSLFLKNDSTVWACGLNDNGQLGDGTTTNRGVPVQVLGLCPTYIPLPIELLSFNATAMDKSIRLNWSTASETNNNFFTIEKSLNGSDWKSIGIVKGAGNSTHVMNYESFDTEPVTGIQYYKLKQTDFDGQYKYSELIAINFSKNFSFSIYPNPVYANSNTTIYLNMNHAADESKPILVVVYDAIGRQVFSKINIQEKNNGQITAVDPSNTLSPGVYIISATSDNSIYKQKLIIR
ncbi:MAG: T9SS type A sorting domain-containing protein [Bacteroidetes bacterium]|nr:T9SS type A sorting domain-containing protein [Bacteroidota bacterium]